jgi:hypothetical protein
MDQRIGELLSRIIPLTDHDVEEILHEQSATNQKFGDIALSLGLCKPEHVLRAWLHQLEHRTERVSIDLVGIDAQALVHLSRATAIQHLALPLRAIENDVLVAVAHVPTVSELASLEACAGRRVKLVLADEAELLAAIDKYYPAPSKSEAA